MVPELVDRRPGLGDRLRPHRAGVSPLQREVLEQQHAELVGGVVRRLRGDVAVHAQRVEPGLDRQLDVAAGVVIADLGERDARRQQVGALDEQPLAVDRAGPVVPRHVAQPGPARAAIARLAVDDDHHVDRRQRLVAERTRPPQLRVADVERPVDLVEAGRQPAFVVGNDDTVDEREQRDSPRSVAVESRRQQHVGARLVGVAAQHAEAVDAHGPGVVHVHRAPDAARVPRAVDAVPVLEHAGDRAPTAMAALRRAGDLDRDHVLVADARERGDVERVRHEVALGIADVRAVEPDVGLVEDAAERQPTASALGRPACS